MAADFTLVIGNKNFSSWSLRPWLLMKEAGVPFAEEHVDLRRADTKSRIASVSSGAGTVPVLKHGSVTVWESLAIVEYIADLFPEKNLWPRDVVARAYARSIVSEMHASFSALRSECSMNLLARMVHFLPTRAAATDIERVFSLWSTAREKFGQSGPFLFGAFTIADAFYAPVVTRLRTYGVETPPVCEAYCNAVFALDGMKEWERGARVELGL